MTHRSAMLPGALVISLDFELHWGVRDRHPVGDAYTTSLLGARAVIPRILDMFEEFEIAATWATVGFLFARSRDELERFSPRLRPTYFNAALSPYAERVGESELEDPLHFASSLIDRIRRSPNQEIATHTFSHYLCGEDGQTAETFGADLRAALAIAGERGIRLRSIVFPRNQHNAAYDSVLRENGMVAYRGNPRSWMWRFNGAEESANRLKRAGRLMDSYVDLTGDGTIGWSEVLEPEGLSNVRASFLVRPYSSRLRHLEPLRLARLRRSVRAAARSRRMLHLWWHPHNFGIDQEENLNFLRGVLTELRACREEFGMRSLNMAEVDRLAREHAKVSKAKGAGRRTAIAVEPARLLHITTIPMSLTFLRGQAGYLKERGFHSHALSSPGPDLEAFGAAEGVPVTAVEMPRRITPVRDLRALAGMLRVLRRVRPTIVHAHTPKGGLLGMIAAFLARVPIRIYHMRGLPLLGITGVKRRVLWCTEWIASRLAHRVFCVSHSVGRDAVRTGVCAPEKIKVLACGSGNGVDAAKRFDPHRLGLQARSRVRRRLGIPPEATVIGFVGRIVRDKGIVELAEAWQSLRELDPELRLLLVGPFEPQDPVPPNIEALLRADPRVHLPGMDWNTPPLYAAMDVIVLPTYREGFPNVPLEAAAMELPVVATRIPGCVDAVEDGVTGTLVQPRDAEALAVAIRNYLMDAVLRHEHGRAGRERVLRDFRQEVIWEELHREYLRLLGRRELPGPATSPVEANA